MIQKQVNELMIELVAERKRLGISQAEISKKMGSNVASISKYELSKNSIPLDMFIKYANAVNRTVIITDDNKKVFHIEELK